MNEEKLFWMVYCEAGHSPEQKHDSIDKAISEARRIAKKTQRSTSVLECIGYFDIPVPEPIYTSVSDQVAIQHAKCRSVLGGPAGVGGLR